MDLDPIMFNQPDNKVFKMERKPGLLCCRNRDEQRHPNTPKENKRIMKFHNKKLYDLNKRIQTEYDTKISGKIKTSHPLLTGLSQEVKWKGQLNLKREKTRQFLTEDMDEADHGNFHIPGQFLNYVKHKTILKDKLTGFRTIRFQ